MLGFYRHDVAAFPLVEMRRPFDRQIVAFGGVGGPNDFARVSVQ